MKTHLVQAAQSRTRPGFSLVELLVVIAIISVLMTVGAIGIGGVTGGKGVTTAVATTEAFFDEARTQALSNNTKARVLVDVNDPKNKEHYLKRLIIVYQVKDDDGKVKEDEWALLNRGLILPDQVFFSRTYSVQDMQGTPKELEVQELSGDLIKADYQGNYVYYEFNGEGVCTTPGASFVVGTGVRPGIAEKPMVTASAKRDFGGFILWRNGRNSLFRTPEQMNLPETVKNF